MDVDKEALARGDVIPDGDEAGDTADQKALAAKEAEAKAASEKDVATKEAEAKAKAENEEAAKKALEEKDKKDHMIPKARFDEAVKKAREEAQVATKRADDLEAQLKASQGEVDAKKLLAEIDTLEDELEKAIADGNLEAKKRLRQEIRDKNQTIAEARASALAARATAVAVEQIRYDALVKTMEAEHPELNPDSEDTFDKDVVTELLELKEAFEKAGHSSSAALEKSLKAVYRNGPKPPKNEAAEKAKAEAKAKADAEAERRKEEAAKRGKEAEGKQPAASDGVASDKGGKDVDPSKNAHKLSDKEFDKLSEEDLKKARGDHA